MIFASAGVTARYLGSTSGGRRLASFATALLFAASQLAAQEDTALPTGATDARASDTAPARAETDVVEPSEDSASDDFDLPEDFELPEGFQPVAVFEVPSEEEIAQSSASEGAVDEITVIGVRRRRSIVDVQQEIKAKTEAFFDEFNELVLDDAYKIKCTWTGGRMKTRVCMAGYLMKEMKDRQFFGQAGVYRRPSREYFDAREQTYAQVIVEALRERPSLMVLAEEITALKEEEIKLSGHTRMLEKKAERERRRELLGPAILRAARDRPGRQRP